MKSSQAQMFIVSAPSGAGKTSLVRAVIDALDDVAVAVSHTTRDMRPEDVEGKDYFYIDHPSFETMINDDKFLEYAEVFGNYYGTSVEAVDALTDQGKDVILEIDWQGAAQVKRMLDEVVWIFILPPSRAELLERLRARGKDSDEVIERRTQDAVSEMKQYHLADYLIVNDNFDEALAELKAVIIAHRVTKARQSKRHAGLITSLTH